MSVISSYLGPVHSAILIFPFLALALTFPYILYEYRHYGAIPVLRTIIIYTFILYLINLYFQVILPLPARSSVTAATAAGLQLDPLHFLRQIRSQIYIDPGNVRTWIAALKQPVVYQAILNVLLFLPLGVYLHYYFRRGIISTFFLCFLASLFCEVTQLTGLYGIYAYPYRTFDVDDLILNTLGGVLGWIVSPAVCLILPSREKIDSAAYRRGKDIPLFRRFLAFAVDFTLISVVQYLLSLLIPDTGPGAVAELLLSLLLTMAYFVGMLTITGGYTVGKWLFRLRLTGRSGASPAFLQLLLRYAYLTFLVFHLPQYWFLGQKMRELTEGSMFYFWKDLQILSQILAVIFLIEVIVRVIIRNKTFFYEKLSGVHNTSTIRTSAGK